MSGDRCRRARYGEAFWRAHHEAWKRCDLNPRHQQNPQTRQQITLVQNPKLHLELRPAKALACGLRLRSTLARMRSF